MSKMQAGGQFVGRVFWLAAHGHLGRRVGDLDGFCPIQYLLGGLSSGV